MKNLLIAFLGLLSIVANAQNVNMIPGDNGGGGFQYTGCSPITFYDTGGPQGNYSNNEDNIAVFCSDIATDLSELNFVRLGLGAGDTLTIYDGDSIAAPVLIVMDETTPAPGLIRATQATPGGCLTVRFRSNGSGTGIGWGASRGCFNPCQAISTIISTTPAADPDGIIRICQGDQVTFNGSANFSDDATGAIYEWDLGNGGGLNPGQVQSETYLLPGSYPVRFIATDNQGCSDRTDVDVSIQVSTDPDFAGTRADDSSICFGETTQLFGNATPTDFTVDISPPITGTTFLPDGSGISYRTCVTVEGFQNGETLNNASDLLEIFINMEHSYTGDLDILLTSPSGATIEIFNQSGGSTFFGEPIDDDTILDPGVGYTYKITESRSATQTLAQAVAATGGGVSLPAGDYLADEPFANLVGSALNGDWCLTITDNLSSDNGYIFEWGINFDPSIIPDELSYTPLEVSSRWLPHPDIIVDNGDVVTVQPSLEGANCYTFEFVDDFGCTYTRDVCVNTTPEIPAGVPVDFTICDTGITTTVNLRDNDSVILTGLNPALYQVNYYLTEADALANTRAITNPTAYPFGTSTQTVYSSVRDIIANCAKVQPVIINVIDFSDIAIPDVVECESIVSLDMEQYIRDNTSIGNSTDITITAHNSRTDAEAGIGAINNINSYDQISGSREFFIKVQSSTDVSCAAVSTINIDVTPSVIPNVLNDLEICDTIDGSPTTFNLEDQNTDVLNGSLDTDFTITYHDSLADAEIGQDELPLVDFENTAARQTIHVRIENNSNPVCYTLNQFDLIVTPLPVLEIGDDLIACDDLSGDGVEVFDLTQNESAITALLTTTNFTISYHRTRDDAISGTDPLPEDYENTNSTDTIHVRVLDNDTSCANVTQFDVTVLPLPEIGTPVTLEECDELGTLQASFALSENTSFIEDGQTNVTVTYYENRAQAIAGGLGLDDSDYLNTSNPQNIFYRVENNSTGCFNIGDFFIEAVDAPIAIMPIDLEQCDEGNGSTIIDLNQIAGDVTAGQPDTTLSFFESLADAEADEREVSSNYEYTEDTTIFIRVDDDNTDCVSFTSVDLIFNELPQPSLLQEYLICVDVDGNLINGPTLMDSGLSNTDHTFEWYLNGTLVAGATNASYGAVEPGDYRVLATSIATGCENSVSTTVRQLGAPDTFDVTILTDPFTFTHNVIATATGPDDYWFSLDDGPYLYTGNFENVLPGPHTVTVAERNGCGEIVEEIFVFGYPDFFTPNDDGYHDTWNIIGGDLLPGTKVYIFDRFGKLIKQVDPSGAGWDGTFNGEPLPSTDYWFKIEFEIDGVSSEATGHFAMKR